MLKSVLQSILNKGYVSHGSPEKQNQEDACIFAYIKRFIYKESAHAIVEAKSQDLQLASCGLRSADGVVSI